MGQVQQKARRQQRLEDLCGATLRALTGDSSLHLRAAMLYSGTRRIPLFAPHLRTDVDRDQLIDYRGASDAMALHLLLSDPRVHRAHCPDEPIERLIFELLEQLRVDALAPDHRPGIASNVRRRFVAWSMQYHDAGLTDNALGLLIYTVAQISWARLNACPVVGQTEDLIEATRAGIVPLLGDDLAALKRHRHDQARYAVAAASIARSVRAMIADAQNSVRVQDDNADDREDDPAAALKLLLDFDEGDDAGFATATSGHSRVFEAGQGEYRVFTRRYDRVVDAAGQVRTALLRDLRERLDTLINQQRINLPRLSRQLATLFARPTRDGWSYGEEEGYIDGRRLAQLVSSPGERRLFQQERYLPKPDTLFTFLIDCSGSMKEHIASVALIVDVFARALERADVSSEILGFTTGAWNGGRASRDWMANGRPRYPGRLNEVMHLVYKDADTRWRRARPSIAAMLKPDLFREGVDGEAIDWACMRMAARPESQRVLMVISDGCPMDTATKLANDEFYLDNHLQDVVARHEHSGQVRIYGLGVGLDLGPYYRHRLALDLSGGVDTHVLDEIVGLLQHR